MPKVHRVANHLRYIRSNMMVVIISFTFTIGAVLAAQAFVRAGSVLANDYGYEQQEEYADDNEYADSSRPGCYEERYQCSPHPTYTPQPTYSPYPTHHPQPSYICTWMKATIAGKTVTLTARSNVDGYGQVVGYRYDFGDGFVTGSSGPLSHTYSNYGTYNTRAWVQYRYYGKLYWTQQCTLIVKVLAPYPTYSPYPTYKPHPTHHPYPTYKPQPTYQPQPTYEPAPTPEPTDEPEPSESPVPVSGNDNGGGGSNTNINNNNSSATANVYLTKGDSAKVVPAGYSSSSSAPTYADTSMPLELPETGTEDTVLGFIGLGGLVAASTAYVMSRRELTDAFLKRN